eukprot:CAMPEP_0168515448 /NCGR_PEP_ID=MMETSP0405-20121227/4762_1 /TAXON_ID=498012 /ORGANISM="Trichosphaerium sp, Strain Am-I-7 wt" /LENGTH=171 /DNA_ID=CAMNT_0008534869 /DNA_START=10 /DNA_END=525 /DNA_ORIENTATION=+
MKYEYRLHSHQVSYGGSGSGQQSVTGFNAGDDTNSYWVTRGNDGNYCYQGTPIKNNQIIRLEHVNTRRLLHSHRHKSPLTKQQEVSCFGNDGQGDESDNWKVTTVSGSEYWEVDGEVRFQHVVTGAYLQMNNAQYGRPIPGQREIVAGKKKAENNKWKCGEGFYFPKRDYN